MRRFVYALLPLLLMPVSAAAQRAYNPLAPYELNLHAGGLFPDDEDAEALLGARFTVNRASGWGYGGNFDWVPLDEGSLDADVNLFLYSFEVDYTFDSPNQLRPFIGAGAGAATTKVSDAADEVTTTETDFLLPLAFGFKFFNRLDDPSWAFRVDVRDNLVWFEDEAGDTDVSNNWELSAGVSILLGE